ncbi:atrial natriuretic peptide receptor 1-like [Paramacrobiotus metropolitanus]|uniref:atrial natriuretic peptide receptor 1-like n=1 Tax=Paramacrobiotus metropolitanus TaxID=2943436 RepID=UPI00244603D8|nr:atrial natriuretic peptide receptor 1-like [Paramacrobiotus metropolitanus]
MLGRSYSNDLLLHCLILNGIFTESVGLANVTLMVYGTWPAFLVQSLPFMGPGFDLAVDQVQDAFASTLSMSRIYVSSKNVKDGVDSGAYFTDVVDYYYRHENHTSHSREQNVLVLIYSGCDDSPMFAELGREWNMMVVSCGTTFSNLRNRDRFPTTIAAGPVQYDLHASAILDLCNRYNWTTIGYLYDTSQLNPFNLRSYQRVSRFLRIYAPHIQINPFAVQDPYRYKELNYELLLNRIAQTSRVMFISAPPWMTREVMIRAYLRNQTTGEYVWFTVDLNEHSLGPVTWQRNETDDEVARAAFAGMFQVINCWNYGSEIDNLRKNWKEHTKTDYNATYPGRNGPNEFTIIAYGIVHVLAQAVNESVAVGADPTNARDLTKRLQDRQFTVPVVGAFRIDQFGERQNTVCVNAFDSANGQFERKLFCDFTNSKLKAVRNMTIVWQTSTGDPPLSEPWCGYTGDAVRCRNSGNAATIASALGATLTVLVLLLIAIFHVNRKSQKARDVWWKMSLDQITIQTPSKTTINGEDRTASQGKGMTIAQERFIWIRNFKRTTNAPFPDKHAVQTMRKLRTFSHPNIVNLFGIIETDRNLLFISEYTDKGSLEDALKTNSLHDWELRSSLSFDLVEGLFAIHHSGLRRHGSLSARKCLIDKRFILKIGALGYMDILRNISTEQKIQLKNLLSIPPELRNKSQHEQSAAAASASDIYVFADIVHILLPEHVFKGVQAEDVSDYEFKKDQQIVHRLRREVTIEPEAFESISLLFSYTTGFTEFVAKNSDAPLNVVHFLDQMFHSFDGVVSLYNVYKVETINDSCMVASGLPECNGDRHAKEVCYCALGFRQIFLDIGKSHKMAIKIGIHSGCDDSPMFGELGREWNLMVLSCGTTFSTLRDRERFPTTIAAGPVQYDLHAWVIMDLCIRYNWTTIAYLYDTSLLNPFHIRAYQRTIRFLRVCAPNIRINPFSVLDSANYKEFNYDLLFDRIAASSRVIFVSATPWMTREIMMRAYLRKQTTGEYVWFTVDLNEHSSGLTTWQRNESDDEVAKAAFAGMFQVINCWDYDIEISDMRKEWKERTRIDYNSTYPGKNGPNEFMITAYSTVHVLAQAINDSIFNSAAEADARTLTKRLQGRQFSVRCVPY